MHSWKLWIRNTELIGYWSQDPGLLGDKITNIKKGRKRINIITNVVLPGRWVIAVLSTIYNSDLNEFKRET